MKKIKNKKGIAMVELMIANTLIVVGILGLVALINSSLVFTRDASDGFITSYLAAEGIEIVRGLVDEAIIREEDWDSIGERFSGTYEVQYDSSSLEPHQGRFLKFEENTGIYSYDNNGAQTSFKRKIRISQNLAEQFFQVNSIVEGSVRGKKISVDVEDRFYNWRRH